MSDILDWIPFERDIYVHMLIEHLKEEKENLEEQQRKNKTRR
jgi:hypothetical protein